METNRREEVTASYRWIKEQLIGKHWQLVSPPLKRMWNPEDVTFKYVGCDGMPCDKDDEIDGFYAEFNTAERNYFIVGKKNYLGGNSSNLERTEKTALADGSRTAHTWHRIVEDIMLLETTGTKYGPRIVGDDPPDLYSGEECVDYTQ